MRPAHPPTVVCVVDADAAVRHALVRLIEAAGLAVRSCDSIDAIAAGGANECVACLVLDVPGTARERAELGARLRLEAVDVPIIALSSRDDATTRHAARDLGAKAFFRKPIDGAALVDSISWLTHA